MDWRLLVKERIINIGIGLEFFLKITLLLELCKTAYCALWGRGGSVAVAVGVSDRRQVTCNM